MHAESPQDGDLYAVALADVVAGVPYNSGTQLLEYFAGRRFAPNVGMSCAFQSFHVAERVVALGGPTAVFLRDGRHVAASYRTDDEMVVLDPYLLHPVPLRVPLHAHPGSRTAVDAYPWRSKSDGSSAPSRLEGSWDQDAQVLRLNYVRYSPTRGHNVLSRSFALPASSAFTDYPSPPAVVRERLLDPEQHSVSVRVVQAGEGLMSEAVLPLRGIGTDNPAVPHQIVTKDNAGSVARPGTHAYQQAMAEVSDVTGMSTPDLVTLLLDAGRTYASAAPVGRDLPVYSLADE